MLRGVIPEEDRARKPVYPVVMAVDPARPGIDTTVILPREDLIRNSAKKYLERKEMTKGQRFMATTNHFWHKSQAHKGRRVGEAHDAVAYLDNMVNVFKESRKGKHGAELTT